jgi:RNA polymerase I-specific transcription initiation factor RRN3
MDPHSTHVQFNQRLPKSGPFNPKLRQMDLPVKPRLDYFPTKSTSFESNKKLSREISQLTMPRPIATNSRIKKDEKYRTDMYLAFVNNALQQKLKVRNIIVRRLYKLLTFNSKYSG